MEEILVRAIKTVLSDGLPDVLRLMEEREPRMRLPAPRKYICAETTTIKRSELPFVQIFSPGESELEYALSWEDSKEPVHIYRYYIDLWISGSDPEELYFQILRYKSAIRTVLKNNINLRGNAVGSIVRSTANSNLMGQGCNLVVSSRIDYSVVALQFLDFPQIGVNY